MAQLTDDCFAFGGELLPVEAALSLIAERVMPAAGVVPAVVPSVTKYVVPVRSKTASCCCVETGCEA